MFETGDPRAGPFARGEPKWATERAYDEDLAKFLGDLACGRDGPEPHTRGLAQRALRTVGDEPSRVWPALFAARVIGPDCPPAQGLPDHMRRQLEELAAHEKR
jgi:hypothetical protein